ncbi:MAG TPA: hypothetical protein VIF64_14635, partial [Pyrinomonadaceae bacterium]
RASTRSRADEDLAINAAEIDPCTLPSAPRHVQNEHNVYVTGPSGFGTYLAADQDIILFLRDVGPVFRGANLNPGFSAPGTVCKSNQQQEEKP